MSSEDVNVRSTFGDLKVVVMLPGPVSQQAYQFRPTSNQEGLADVPRRDLTIIRAMLQDALQDIDDELRRQAQTTYERSMGAVPLPVPYPGYPR